jgi:hypothetical protein
MGSDSRYLRVSAVFATFFIMVIVSHQITSEASMLSPMGFPHIARA